MSFPSYLLRALGRFIARLFGWDKPKPVPEPVTPLRVVIDGGLLDPEALVALERFIEAKSLSLPGLDSGARLRPLLPPLSRIPDLLALSWRVLEGDPGAENRFRAALDGFGTGIERSTTWARARRVLDERHGRRRPGPRESHATENPLAPRTRLLPVMAAAVYSARDEHEAARLTASIEAGLAGLGELTQLFEATVLAGDAYDRNAALGALGTLVRKAMTFPVVQANGLWEPGFGWPPGRFGLWPPGEGSSRWPPDNPEPFPEPDRPGLPDLPNVPDLFAAFERCMSEIIENIARDEERRVPPWFRRGQVEGYVIDEVAPYRPCPGDEVILTGTGFSGTSAVRFTRAGGSTIRVAANSVSDTQVTATVPVRAASGPIGLVIEHTTSLCGGFTFTNTKSGTPGTFLAGGAQLLQFGVDGYEVVGDQACLPPNQDFMLTWAAEPMYAQVHLYEIIGADRIELHSGGGGSGSVTVTGNDVRFRRFQIFVRNQNAACEVIERHLNVNLEDPAPTLAVIGVETTQGVQRFSLTNADDGNSMPLIAGKDTVLRVFVSCDRGGFNMDESRITGFMTFRSNRYEPINEDAFGPQPFVTARPWPDRDRVNDSLNFRIDAPDARGEHIAEIEIFTDDGCSGFVSLAKRVRLRWIEVPPLAVTVRRIADPWTHDALTEEEAMQVVVEAFDRLPSPATSISVFPGTFDIQNLSAEANYCHDGGFYQLALSLAYEHNGVEGLWPDPHESIWIGLYFQTGCDTGGMMSWPWTSTCISSRRSGTAAHEIAHCVGMGHTVTSAGEQCENITQPIACHWLPDDGAVGEVVFDIRENRTITDAHDLMSYQATYRFPHPHHWKMIRGLIRNRA